MLTVDVIDGTDTVIYTLTDTVTIYVYAASSPAPGK